MKKITESCPECKLCGKKCHRLPSHLSKTHNMTKEEYIILFPESKLYSDEYIDIHENTKLKISEGRIKYFKNDIDGTAHKLLSDIQKNIQANIPKEIKSKRAILRNRQLKENKDKYNHFTEKCSLASRKFWDNADEETKLYIITNWNNGWKKWYNNLDEEEKIIRHRNNCKTHNTFLINFENKTYNFKSKFEYDVFLYLINNNIKNIEYENIIVKTENNKNHYPDFYLPDYNLILECKGIFKKYTKQTLQDILSDIIIKKRSVLSDERNFNYHIIWYNRDINIVYKNLDNFFKKMKI